ncbi:uncharacterized protein LOC113862738 [Abrus precatorius]|uniref:Uncharacterized protein LOC113862738 n=1 Tax=Abrus precatorius TaxID=3816 RepID=A0A8B8LAC4_ABRPR|nr:uncharacterized protein LOC113862738 [Abrus precatorius]
MASRKGFLSKASYIFGSSSESETHLEAKSKEGDLELDEAEVWGFYNNSNTVTEGKKGLRSALKRGCRKVEGGGRVSPVASASLPVNIPDWSKILKEDYKEHRKRESDDEDVVVGDEPPHEYLARTRGASLSVHEGRGRTLKGRDLRRVRNAIWKKVGFED